MWGFKICLEETLEHVVLVEHMNVSLNVLSGCVEGELDSEAKEASVVFANQPASLGSSTDKLLTPFTLLLKYNSTAVIP